MTHSLAPSQQHETLPGKQLNSIGARALDAVLVEFDRLLADGVDELLVDQEDELEARDLQHRVVAQARLGSPPDRSAVDEYAPPALVGDVELGVVPQFDDALSARDLPGGPLQLEVDVDAGVLGAPPALVG